MRRQLAARLAGLIRDGHLPPGTRLPSIRELAGVLELHRNTVWATYRRLAEAKLVVAVHGSGVYVGPVGAERLAPVEGPGLRPTGECGRPFRAPVPHLIVLLEPWKKLRRALHQELQTRVGLPVHSLHPRRSAEAADSPALMVARTPVLCRLGAERRSPTLAVPLDLSGGSRELDSVARLPSHSVVALITHFASVRRYARTLAATSGRPGVGFTSPRPEDATGVRRATRIADIVFVDGGCRRLVDPRDCRRLIELRLLSARSVEAVRRGVDCRAG